MAKFKEYILEQYDDNCDGKISMTEVSKLKMLLTGAATD